MKLRLLLATASAAAVTTLNAHAVSYGNYQLEALTGTGTNTSVCVFDFGATEYAFGYRYDGQKTGADLLTALNNTFGISIAYDATWGTPASINYNSYNMITGVASDGGHISALFNYSSGGTAVNDWVEPAVTINYVGGGTGGPIWTFAETGFASRYLTDGSWDGWIQGTYKGWTGYSTAPDGPSPIPEPTALGLLALGAMVFWRGRRS